MAELRGPFPARRQRRQLSPVSSRRLQALTCVVERYLPASRPAQIRKYPLKGRLSDQGEIITKWFEMKERVIIIKMIYEIRVFFSKQNLIMAILTGSSSYFKSLFPKNIKFRNILFKNVEYPFNRSLPKPTRRDRRAQDSICAATGSISVYTKRSDYTRKRATERPTCKGRFEFAQALKSPRNE